MQNDEVADLFDLSRTAGIVSIAQRAGIAAARQMVEEAEQVGEDQMDAGRFQRFEEARG